MVAKSVYMYPGKPRRPGTSSLAADTCNMSATAQEQVNTQFSSNFLLSFQDECTKTAADLSESLRVGAHISEDDKDVLLTLIGQILC